MKIIIIDDDPTGSQTVNGCNLILRWDYETLLKGLKDSSNLLFILANTRSLSKKDVRIRLKEICSALREIMNHSKGRGQTTANINKTWGPRPLPPRPVPGAPAWPSHPAGPWPSPAR